VLRQLASAPLAAEDRATVLQTMRALAPKLGSMTPQVRGRLRRLPLWTGSEWRTMRPIYAFEDDGLSAQAANQVAVWKSGFSSFADLDGLLEALDVTPLRLDDFMPFSLGARGAVEGDHLRPRFALAIQHLRDELARGDQALHDSLAVNWNDLCTAQVIVEERLRLTANPSGREPIIVEVDAHMLREPLALVVRSEDSLATAEGAGRAIGSLFPADRDRQKVAWAWVSMWQRAGEGVTPDQIILATNTDAEDDGGTKRLIQLQGQAKTRGARNRGKQGKRGVQTGVTTTVTVQPLKDLTEYEPDEGMIVNEGQSRSGVIFPPRPPGADTSRRRDVTTGSGETSRGASTARRTVPAPVSDREQLALDAVQKALRLDPPEIADVRKRHGIGADAMDQLRQFYEIKMESSGDFPSEVTLQRSQVDAAQDNKDFFLAVVAGLSADSDELRVRFIFNPLQRLAIRIKGEATVSGVAEVEALEYRFRKMEQEGS
jgi:hypothetical protein